MWREISRPLKLQGRLRDSNQLQPSVAINLEWVQLILSLINPELIRIHPPKKESDPQRKQREAPSKELDNLKV